MTISKVIATAKQFIEAFTLHPTALRVRGVAGKSKLQTKLRMLDRFDLQLAKLHEREEVLRAKRNETLAELDAMNKMNMKIARTYIKKENVKNDFLK